jgi:hypothetical protein
MFHFNLVMHKLVGHWHKLGLAFSDIERASLLDHAGQPLLSAKFFIILAWEVARVLVMHILTLSSLHDVVVSDHGREVALWRHGRHLLILLHIPLESCCSFRRGYRIAVVDTVEGAAVRLGFARSLKRMMSSATTRVQLIVRWWLRILWYVFCLNLVHCDRFIVPVWALLRRMSVDHQMVSHFKVANHAWVLFVMDNIIFLHLGKHILTHRSLYLVCWEQIQHAPVWGLDC